ncbi:MAG TPA: GNAT family N-acetyltransferase [Mycobacteriales bacterium]|nr:GNAT family N-acetyltransferase [Mycobacteriales bacterium]
MGDIEVSRESDRWTARRGETDMGWLATLVRPDQRCVLSFADCVDAAYEPLLAAVTGALDGDLYMEIDQVDEASLARCTRYGFTVKRREHLITVPTDPATTGLGGVVLPHGYVSVTAAEVGATELRLLDDELRQDVPGSDGWRWTPQWFAREMSATDFDPATYRIAVHRPTGGYAGLARVWLRRSGPRLGLIATARGHRGRGVARALLAEVFAVLDGRGHPAVSAEVDHTNAASLSLLGGLGARVIGGTVELLRPRAAPPRND